VALAVLVDWPTLQVARERGEAMRLRSYRADLVFTANLVHGGRVLILLEHKSGPDGRLRLQVLRYAVHLLWQAERRGDATPAVLPVVLRHGPTEPCVAPGDPDPFVPFQPQLHMLVDDLNQHDEHALRGRGLPAAATLTLLALAAVQRLSGGEILLALDRWQDLLQSIEREHGPESGEDALDDFGWYLLMTTDITSEELQMAFQKNLAQPHASLRSTGQRLIEQGLSQGLSQGLVEGEARGQVKLLLRQLARRFGPLPAETEPQLRRASQVELDRIADRLLEAHSLAEVFAG
jgi:hypothetical protein